jgi:hypothetical protein
VPADVEEGPQLPVPATDDQHAFPADLDLSQLPGRRQVSRSHRAEPHGLEDPALLEGEDGRVCLVVAGQRGDEARGQVSGGHTAPRGSVGRYGDAGSGTKAGMRQDTVVARQRAQDDQCVAHRQLLAHTATVSQPMAPAKQRGGTPNRTGHRADPDRDHGVAGRARATPSVLTGSPRPPPCPTASGWMLPTRAAPGTIRTALQT